MVKARKTSYRVTNWAKYNEALVNRGSITLWFDEAAIANWRHENSEVRPGRRFIFSDTAIECLLMVREVFRLPYRHTEGFSKSLIQLLEIDIPVPDYSSLAKRAAKLNVNIKLANRRGPVDLVMDSTGLKVFGDGEWKARKYGPSKRRTWRKVHLAINPKTQEIEAEVTTENSGHDADQAGPMLQQVSCPVKKVYGDGAYDKWKVYNALKARDITPIIPPQRNAKIKQHGNLQADPLPRDVAIRGVRRLGRAEWKRQIGYHQRSLGETAMFRLKTTFGGELKNRSLATQQTEVRIRCKILNRLAATGLPRSKPI
jgi:hypothetical protein